MRIVLNHIIANKLNSSLYAVNLGLGNAGLNANARFWVERNHLKSITGITTTGIYNYTGFTSLRLSENVWENNDYNVLCLVPYARILFINEIETLTFYRTPSAATIKITTFR